MQVHCGETLPSPSPLRCTVLHGGKTQDVREVSIKGFRDNTFNILIATDVAGRGIDVPDITLVVNYDMPGGIVSAMGRVQGLEGCKAGKGVWMSGGGYYCVGVTIVPPLHLP